ncbi:hypothetical protein EDC23_2509 [Thiohalophilus thiocyanatoxydans]|uniref:Uncharacterized protein n=2 Tax=Thiohalophilus thiocyanatoxydans TaxID=381308 RepID=A0A4R8IJZ6_9GAMM|nr:hypothetical protein EDC23_2509 [Thiohalophilus thiocyanatoxydans]
MYSRRLLLPYIGVIQVAELGRAHALSLDGVNWAIRYALADKAQLRNMGPTDDPRLSYPLIATIKQDWLEMKGQHPLLDANELRSLSQQLYEAVTAASVPFAAGDYYEYWLLDCTDGSPLALLHSTADEEELRQRPPRPVWLAMPASQLYVEPPEPPQAVYVPPVNYRLEKLIEERAGNRPRGAWFERTNPATDGFPPCLVQEAWEDDAQQRLCERYLQRLAPRLLMMDGLSRSVRRRLEQAARDQVFEVEKFYPLYPEVIDDSVLTTARVEARIRRANS